ncbi:response regulator [Simiduia curdlanivorans]|uniref:Response regulator n=1 Tax=Simiduia curdlanivorans TaxID=1492769 RepID=A0ABV8V1W4_9GAMM|nr:response regulator [Simiduia curdlanivorans]MDN3640098.1 response regulator [Simiduia curdlanivorans]
MTQYCILIVEDEEKLAQVQAEYLNHEGFRTHQIHDGNLVLDWVKNHQPDAITLDIMLPNVDGLTLLREIRKFSNIPIIMVTAKVEEVDRLIGLELQADDYLCKPFSPREMVARVKTILRRTAVQKKANIEPVTNSPSLELKVREHKVSWKNQVQTLTTVECQLLERLMNHPGHIFSRSQLMESIYNDHRIVSERTIDSHIKKLRKKLATINPGVEFIHSIYGAGYKYEPE